MPKIEGKQPSDRSTARPVIDRHPAKHRARAWTSPYGLGMLAGSYGRILVFANVLIILASSLLVIALFRRLSLPPVLGYLCVGLLIGPTALNWVGRNEDLPHLAEWGVVFLLFTLGLEFSLPRMLALRSVVFGLGSLQVLACGAALAALLYWFELPLQAALLLGAGLARRCGGAIRPIGCAGKL